MAKREAAWTAEERAQLGKMAAAGTDLRDAVRTLGRRQTDIVSEARRQGFRIVKRSRRERWAIHLDEIGAAAGSADGFK